MSLSMMAIALGPLANGCGAGGKAGTTCTDANPGSGVDPDDEREEGDGGGHPASTDFVLEEPNTDPNPGPPLPPPETDCPASLAGWATMEGATTGGRGGKTVTVSTASELADALGADGPTVIEFSGTIRGVFSVGSNKTLRGTEKTAVIDGSLLLSGSRNVILQNFNVDARNSANEDGIGITNASHHIWVDHLAVFDAADGNLDIKRESDFITVSWTKFYYRRDGGHRLSNLIGHSDSHSADEGHLNVTLHHCWWEKGVSSRMPRVRFGRVHSYNNYFASPGNGYCIRAAKGARVLIENNYFDGVKTPHEIDLEDGSPAKVLARDNIYNNTSGARDETGSAFDPPYAYTVDPAESIPERVKRCAGPQ